jgi:hypothetical protein
VSLHSASLQPVSGHAPEAVADGTTTTSIGTAGYGATLYAIAFGSLDDTLSYTLQDSDDGTNWATVTAVVNAVAGQTLTVAGVANTTKVVLVRHAAVRRHHRFIAAAGAGSDYGCVIALLLLPDQESGAGPDYIVGG